MEKRWRCTVCGYAQRGETAPAVCPVCGVGSEKFEQMAAEGAAELAPAAEKGLLQEMIDSFIAATSVFGRIKKNRGHFA